jgi:hypothetical protein
VRRKGRSSPAFVQEIWFDLLYQHFYCPTIILLVFRVFRQVQGDHLKV